MRVDVEAGGIQVWQTFRGGSWEGKGEKLTAEGAGGREVAVAVQTLAARKIWEVRGGCKCTSLRSGIGLLDTVVALQSLLIPLSG
jgi:hypothetical protein